MVKRNHMRSKLKAADRRRQRRLAGAHSVTSNPVANPTVDVVGLIVKAILSFRDGSRRFDDAIIIAALKACRCGIRPGGEQAAALFDELQVVAERESVSPRAMVRAANHLLSQSNQRAAGSGQPNPFACYLRILAS